MKKFTREKLILMAAHIALDHAVQFMMMHDDMGPEDLAEVLEIATRMNADLISKIAVTPGHC